MILNDNSTQQINTLLIQLQNRITNLTNEFIKLNDKLNNKIDNKIDNLDSKISDLEKNNDYDVSEMNAKIKANTEAISGKADKNHTHIKSEITDFDHTHDDRYYTESEVDTKLSGKADKIHTHTKSQITDFPTSLPANGGTADYANVPTGFKKIGSQDIWGNQDGEFITDWQSANSGDISFRVNKGQLNLIIDGVFYQNEGRYKLVDENSIKNIMKPNYTTGRLPAGIYGSGQTVSVSASITTTRGNPVFISYFGDYNNIGSGDTVPWISFELYADDQIVQRTVADNSVALNSDNTPFSGGALAVLSAGSHIIRLDAVLRGDVSGQVQFQEQENYVNLVAFEL